MRVITTFPGNLRDLLLYGQLRNLECFLGILNILWGIGGLLGVPNMFHVILIGVGALKVIGSVQNIRQLRIWGGEGNVFIWLGVLIHKLAVHDNGAGGVLLSLYLWLTAVWLFTRILRDKELHATDTTETTHDHRREGHNNDSNSVDGQFGNHRVDKVQASRPATDQR